MNNQNLIQITTDQSKIDLDFVHKYLSETSYWAKGISKELVEKSIRNSMSFSVLKNEIQVGFARVITDYTTFAYIADVFIDELARGNGLSKKLMRDIMEHQDLQGIRRWMLMTWDAHGLYEQFGFYLATRPDRIMEISKSKN